MIVESGELYAKLTDEHASWMMTASVCLALLLLLGLAITVAIERRRHRLPLPEPQSIAGFRFHGPEMCHPPCPLHHPSDHPMADWTKVYRYYKGIFERNCTHGVGHPDPDSLAYVQLTRGQDHAATLAIHGCDGCCTRAADEHNSVGQPGDPVP